jgi:hypothetical protein
VGEPRDDRLHEPVAGFGDPAGVHDRDQRDQPEQQQGRQHPDVEEVAGVDRERGADADEHEAQVEDEGEPLADQQVEGEHHEAGRHRQPRDAAA